jgi:hypothetical protein
MDNDDDDIGGVRGSDPPSAREGARSVKVIKSIKDILRDMELCSHALNGWELSVRLNRPTITVVNRLAPARRLGLITLVEQARPGPPPRYIGQMSYVISDLGRDVLAGRAILTAQAIRTATKQSELTQLRKEIFELRTKIQALELALAYERQQRSRGLPSAFSDRPHGGLFSPENYRGGSK